jgi:succinyl-diaminopimelate desuccinylase
MVQGRIYGRGACDMKGGLAALAVAAEAVARSERRPGGDLVFCATADQENGCRGAEALAAEPLFAGSGGVLIGEPSALDVYVAGKGALWMEAVFAGRTAHAAMAEHGTNAVIAAVDFIARLRQNSPVAGPTHPVLGGATLNVGTIHGGVKASVVPDRCAVTLDMRTVPGVSHDTISRRVSLTLNAVTSSHPGIQAELATTLDREPVISPALSTLALAAGQAIRQVLGKAPRPTGTPYLSEGCIWAPKLNLPMVICGPGDRTLAHQPDEYVEVLELEQAARIYVLVMERLLFDEGE